MLRLWLGGAAAIAQVEQLSITGTVPVGARFLLTAGANTLVVAAPSTDLEEIALAIADAINNRPFGELADCAAEADGAIVLLTAVRPGTPFVVVAETTASDGEPPDGWDFEQETLTVSSGPEHWDSPANWSGGVLPANGDAVVIDRPGYQIRFGLDQSEVALASLEITAVRGELGLPRVNADGGYPEYRQQYLAIGVESVRIGAGNGQGADLIRLDTLDSPVIGQVVSVGGGNADGPALLLRGGHAENTWVIQRGAVGLAYYAGEEFEAASVKVGSEANQGRDAEVTIGAGAKITRLEQASGRVGTYLPALAAIYKTSGTLVSYLTDVGLLENFGGTVQIQGGMVQVLRTNSLIDFSGDPDTKRILSVTLYNGAGWNDPHGVAEVPGCNVRLAGCRIEDIRPFDIGADKVIGLGECEAAGGDSEYTLRAGLAAGYSPLVEFEEAPVYTPAAGLAIGYSPLVGMLEAPIYLLTAGIVAGYAPLVEPAIVYLLLAAAAVGYAPTVEMAGPHAYTLDAGLTVGYEPGVDFDAPPGPEEHDAEAIVAVYGEADVEEPVIPEEHDAEAIVAVYGEAGVEEPV